MTQLPEPVTDDEIHEMFNFADKVCSIHNYTHHINEGLLLRLYPERWREHLLGGVPADDYPGQAGRGRQAKAGEARAPAEGAAGAAAEEAAAEAASGAGAA